MYFRLRNKVIFFQDKCELLYCKIPFIYRMTYVYKLMKFSKSLNKEIDGFLSDILIQILNIAKSLIM